MSAQQNKKTSASASASASAVGADQRPSNGNDANNDATAAAVTIDVTDDDDDNDVIDDAEAEAERIFRHFSTDDPADKNILMSALSSLLGPNKAGSGRRRFESRKCSAIANTTLFLVDKNENYEWRANVSALDDVFVDPSRPPVKGRKFCPHRGAEVAQWIRSRFRLRGLGFKSRPSTLLLHG